jgi:hypothetical protein
MLNIHIYVILIIYSHVLNNIFLLFENNLVLFDLDGNEEFNPVIAYAVAMGKALKGLEK